MKLLRFLLLVLFLVSFGSILIFLDLMTVVIADLSIRSSSQTLKLNSQAPRWFPIWAYLAQLVFRSQNRAVNPFRFWQSYQVERLEDCWNKTPIAAASKQGLEPSKTFEQPYLAVGGIKTPEVVQFLEQCWVQDIKKLSEES
ncbi:MAG: hypothetical protein Kow00121_14990 [Elainellaceae cyanobacterium]